MTSSVQIASLATWPPFMWDSTIGRCNVGAACNCTTFVDLGYSEQAACLQGADLRPVYGLFLSSCRWEEWSRLRQRHRLRHGGVLKQRSCASSPESIPLPPPQVPHSAVRHSEQVLCLRISNACLHVSEDLVSSTSAIYLCLCLKCL